MNPLRTALPSVARDALRLADDPAFGNWWQSLTEALEAVGEGPVNFASARDAYDAGWSVEGAAHEIADMRWSARRGIAPWDWTWGEAAGWRRVDEP